MAKIIQMTDKNRAVKCMLGKYSTTQNTQQKQALFYSTGGKAFLLIGLCLCLKGACDCSAVAQPM